MKFTNLLLILTFLAFSITVSAQKISVDDIIARHVASLGTAEKLKSIKNRVLLGDIEYSLKGIGNPVKGQIVLVSANEKNLWGMNLSDGSYPMERFGFDGKNTRVGFTRPGVRSQLGNILFLNNFLVKESLLGGSLVSSWALLDVKTKNPKLSYEGTKEINGRNTYAVSYVPKKGSDLSIKMYFDQETFRHVRTEYNLVIAASQGATVNTSANQTAERYRIIEDFSNFKDVNGLILPSDYKIYYNYVARSSLESEWKFHLTNFSYNQPLDDTSFNINEK